MTETTRRPPSMAELAELRSGISDLSDRLAEAADAVYQTFLIHEEVSEQFRLLLETPT